MAACPGGKVLGQVPETDFWAALPRLRTACGDRAVLRAIHYYEENARTLAQRRALLEKRFADFAALVLESGRASFALCQNVYCATDVRHQGLSVALALSQSILQGSSGAWRMQGGGFAGTIQAYVPETLLQRYHTAMERVFGPAAAMCSGCGNRAQDKCCNCRSNTKGSAANLQQTFSILIQMDSAQREGIGLLLCCKMLDRFRGRGAQPENGGCQQLVVDTVAKQHHVLDRCEQQHRHEGDREGNEPFAQCKIVQMKAAQKLIQRILEFAAARNGPLFFLRKHSIRRRQLELFMNEHSFQAETRNTQAARPAATEGSCVSVFVVVPNTEPNRFFSDRYMLRTCA